MSAAFFTMSTTPEFGRLVNTFFRLYGYAPPQDPAMLIGLRDTKSFDQSQKLLSTIIGYEASKTLTEIAVDLVTMPLDQIIILESISKEADLNQYENVVSEKTEPVTVSHQTVTPQYVKLLGKITPDLAAQNPRGVLPIVFDRILNDKNLDMDRDKLSSLFSPLASKILENDADADSLHRITTLVLQENGIDQKQAQDYSNKLLIFHLSNPAAVHDELRGYLNRLLPKDKEGLNNLVADQVDAHEQARVSNPKPEYESVKNYIAEIEKGKVQNDNFIKHYIKDNDLDIESALKKFSGDEKDIQIQIDAIRAKGTNFNSQDANKLMGLYFKLSQIQSLKKDIVTHDNVIKNLRLQDKEKAQITPLENELTAQYAAAGLTAIEARKLAREFINSDLAVSTQYLAGFADSDKTRPKLTQDLHSEALAYLSQHKPELAPLVNKLKGFKLNAEKFDQAFQSVAYFRNLIDNPASMIQIFSSKVINQFVNQLGIKYATDSLKKELISQALVKFAGSEVGKKILTEAVKKGLALFAKEGLKRGLEAVTAATGIGPIVTEVAFFLADKLMKPLKDLYSWAQQRVKENLQMAAAGVAALIAGLGGLGIGGAAAVGGVTYVVGGVISVTGGILTATPSASLLGAVRTAGGVLTTIVTDTASESVSALVLILLFLPVSLALMLFIINTSAHVVPQELNTVIGQIGCWPIVAVISQDPCALQCGACTHQSGIDMNAFDLAAPEGTEVWATHDGTIVYANWNTDGMGYGNYVIIEGNDPAFGGSFRTLYGHLSSIIISSGSVKVGETIGLSGNTGNSTGPHLHYELRVNSPTTSAGQCSQGSSTSLANYVPPGWSYPGTTEYTGTCYANGRGLNAAGGGGPPAPR